MKINFLKIGFFAVMLAMVCFATSCAHNHDHDGEGHEHHDGHDSEDGEDTETSSSTVDMSSKEYASAYICPMHCEGSGSDAEGTCPVCKMDYVANDKHSEDNHEH